VAPNTAMLSTPTDPTTATNASFTFNSSETPLAHECRIDAGTFAACTSPKDYTGLAAGSHTFDVRAIDAAGNADATPPSYTWTINAAPSGPASAWTPGTGTTDVPLNVAPTITFAQPMDALTITRTSFSLTPPVGAALLATAVYNATTRTATLTPSKPLEYSKTYTAKADTTIKDATGTPLAAPITWSFTTSGAAWTRRVNSGGAAYTSPSGAAYMADTPVPGVLSMTGGLTRSTTAAISGTTDQQLYKDERYGVFTENVVVPNGTYDVKLHFAETQNAAAGARVFDLDVLETLVMDVDNLDIRATAGLNTALVRTIPNVSTSIGVIRFRSVTVAGDPVLSAIEIIPQIPTITTKTPTAGATGITATTTVTATFSRAMDPASFTSSTFTLRKQTGGAVVTANFAYDAATKTATLTPTSPLAPGTTYVAEVARTVRATDGMWMAGPVSWTFTT
jgi:Big-like domain-containing protein/malectin (di-glucose binding ER protein)